MSLKLVPPSSPRTSRTKTCALVAFRIVRTVQTKAAQVPCVPLQARKDVAAASRESGNASPNVLEPVKLMTGLMIFPDVALILAKLPRRLMLRALHHDVALDLAVSIRGALGHVLGGHRHPPPRCVHVSKPAPPHRSSTHIGPRTVPTGRPIVSIAALIGDGYPG